MAVEINPRTATAYNNRGIAWGKKGDLDQAISDFTMALEIDARYAQAYINRGITWAETGDLERGLIDAKKALSLEPKNRSYQKIVAFLEDQIGSKE
jgi:tetratricopeptide (TPR) repeat protein